MPHASHHAIIDAPFTRVQHLLTDKVEKPKKYIGSIQWSRIMEHGDGFVIREYYEPAPADRLVREKIYERAVEGGTEYVFEHMNNVTYGGSFKNILTHVDGREDQCRIEYIMDWIPHPGAEDRISPEMAGIMVRNGVNHLKEMAEHPVEVPDFVRAFYHSVDSMQPDAMEPLLADNVRFRIGSNTDVLGKQQVIELNRHVFATIKKIGHDFVEVYHDRGKTFVECFVNYVMPDDSTYLLPFLTVFERSGDKITNIKVYGDMMPLMHGWPKH
jgi:hypothetical protein